MKTILIVDHEFLSESIKDSLNRTGFAVLTVAKAKSALVIIRSGTPVDVVIMELLLPDMDGIEFLKAVKRDRPDLKVLVVTSNGTVESYLSAASLGVIDYLNKPVLSKELSHIVHTACGSNGHASRSRDAGNAEP